MEMELQRRSKLPFDLLEYDLSLYLGNPDETVTTFPNALLPSERDYILKRVSKLNGIRSELQCRREMECLSLHKHTLERIRFSLSNTSRRSLGSLMVATSRESSNGGGTGARGQRSAPSASNSYAHFQHHSRNDEDEMDAVNNVGCGNRLHINYPPLVPPARASDEFSQHRKSLPIWRYKDQIMTKIMNHRVVIIQGKSGSGKSTQVPQFIMESATSNKRPTKILACHPHRVSAIAASSCVARERGERLGISVGYQARLESCYSPCASILLFSTSELFLRSLIPPTFPVLNNLSYVILDDVHVRNATSDFALACLLSLLPSYQFKLILLCGEMDNEGLLAYIRSQGVGDVQLISIDQEVSYAPSVYYLEDIEKMLQKSPGELSACALQGNDDLPFCSPMDTQNRCKCCNLSRSGHLVNLLIHRYLFLEDENAAEEFTDLVLRHEVDIHGRHQATGLDFCAAAALKGDISIVRRLYGLGANVFRTLKNGFNTVNILEDFRQPEVANFINFTFCNSPSAVQRITNITPINLGLIVEIIQRLHTSSPLDESIVVILSSYDEIITLKEMLFSGDGDVSCKLNPHSIVVSLLHVNIPCGDEKIIFEEHPDKVRKIVLTTDIADTVCIKDTVHLIDGGYTEEKSYNAKNSATGNRKVLISQSSARERKRRHTFRLYDLQTFQKMAPYRTPEILQSPLQELCLYSSSLLKNPKAMMDFFGQFLSPPSGYSLNRSFQELVEIGALDKTRKMTALGCYLLDFPVEPRLGKALIYASILRCLDPVLTIVAALSHRDPFKTPKDSHDQVRIRNRKEELSKQTFSDHMTMLQAFLEWENECGCGSNTSTSLTANNVSPGIFDMICAIRTDLLGQLRAFGFVRCKGVGNIKDLNFNSHNWSVVKAALIAALYPNVMRIDQSTWGLSNNEFENARFHPLSCMARDPVNPVRLPSVWTMYEEVNQSAEMSFCKGCTLVSTFSLLVFGGSPYRNPEVEEAGNGLGGGNGRAGDRNQQVCKVKLNEWVVLEGARVDVDLVLKIRKKFQNLLEKQLRKPGTLLTPHEDKDLQTIALILTTEDRAAGLSQIDGIGKWPRYAGGSLLSVPCQGFTKSATSNTPDDA